MPRFFDAGEAQEFLTHRITNLLRDYGTGVSEVDEQPGWKITMPTSTSLLIENTEEKGYPRLLVSVEVSN